MTSLETAQHLRAAYHVPGPAYYNDNDPGAAAWLRELMAAGLITEGTIDEQSITEVQPEDLAGFTHCHFFAGIAGWDLAIQYSGWPADRPVWTASCPCQPISCAGQRKGHADERHLWPALYTLISECRPATVIGEQVASTDGREWLAGIRADLEGAGYAVGAADLCAAGVGAPHRRQRLFWVAHAEHHDGRPDQPGRRAQGRETDGRAGSVADTQSVGGGTSGETGGHRTFGADRIGGGGQPGSLGDVQRARLEEPGTIAHRDGPDQGLHLRGYSAWSNFTTILCRDNKTRRFERQPAALDDGLPALVDALRRAGASQAEIAAALETFPLAQNQPGRVSLLRGYGNSIVVPLAAEFIRAIP